MTETIEQKFKTGDWVFFPFREDGVTKYYQISDSSVADEFNQPGFQTNHCPRISSPSEVLEYYNKQIKKCHQKILKYREEIYFLKILIKTYKCNVDTIKSCLKHGVVSD